MIVTGKELLSKAKAGKYAVPALNVDNLESVIGVLRAAEETGKSIIVQTIPRTLDYGGVGTYSAMIRALYGGGADICIHLDHGGSEEICRKCIEKGYTSVMIDGSALPFEENVKLTAKVADIAHAAGVSVEGELGTIGGKEQTEGKISYTDPKQAREFAMRTGVDSLAVGVGTAHGVYKGVPHIAVDRIAKIAARTSVPLVLHGGTGIPTDQIKKAISLGVAKINVNTECQLAFQAATRKYIEEGKDLVGKGFDPRKLLAPGAQAIKDTVKEKMEIFGCINKA